ALRHAGSLRPGRARPHSRLCARTRRQRSWRRFAPDASGRSTPTCLHPARRSATGSSCSLADSTRMRFAELDAVTVDGYGTLLHLTDPVPALRAALAERGIERSAEDVARAFGAEVAYYRPRALEGRDTDSLAALRRECTRVFLHDVGDPLDESGFVEAFMGALTFETVPGASETLRELRERGLKLGVVANWDCALPDHLR